jgi:hypothetical protein
LGGGGLAFEVPAMSLGQLSERKWRTASKKSRWRRLVSRSNKITLKLVSGPTRFRTNRTVQKEGETNRQHWSEAKDAVMCQTTQAVGLLLWLQESLKLFLSSRRVCKGIICSTRRRSGTLRHWTVVMTSHEVLHLWQFNSLSIPRHAGNATTNRAFSVIHLMHEL